MKSILVVPSCREACFREFLDAWGPVADWDELILVEDNPTRTFSLGDRPFKVRHFAWEQIERDLGRDAWIFSRRDSAIRSYGFLMAYRMGADLIVTLDDDCFPSHGTPIVAGHKRAMESHPRWVPSVPGMRTRGLPYRNLGTLLSAVNVGLWSGVPDLDAVQSLGIAATGGFTPPHGSRIIPARQYVPLCGMNLAFVRPATPLMFFPLMGEGQPYRRFDDIWCGVIAKKVLDHMGWPMSVGDPFVEHRRASDPFANLVKEAPGIAANETFWEAIDACPLQGKGPVECMSQLGDWLERRCADPYLAKLGRALRVWAGLFDA